MVENKTLEYEVEILSIETTIKNIKSSGVDTTEFDQKLIKLKEETKESLAEVKKEHPDMPMFIDQAYTVALKDARTISTQLDSYEIFFHIMSKCSHIDMIVNEDINKTTFNEIVDELIDCLKSVRTSNAIDYSDAEKAVNKLYETTYNVMKLEFKMNNESRLFEYSDDYRINSLFLSKLILQDIDKLEEEGFDISAIKNRFDELNSKDNSGIYLDRPLLRLICGCKNEKEIKEDLENSIKQMNEIVSKNCVRIEELKKKGEEAYQELKDLDQKRKKSNRKKSKEKAKSVGTLVISAAALGGLLFGTWKMSRLVNSYRTYETTTTTYSSDTNTTNENTEFVKRLDNNEVTKLEIIESWQKNFNEGGYKRNITTYDLSDIDLASELAQFAKIDLENLGIEGTTRTEYKDELSLGDTYGQSITKVTKTVQNLDNYQKEVYNTRRIIFGVIYNLQVLLYAIRLELSLIKNKTRLGLIGSIVYLRKQLELLDEDSIPKEKLKELKKRCFEINKEVEELITSNEKIRAKFEELRSKEEYKDYIAKYDETKELLKGLEIDDEEQGQDNDVNDEGNTKKLRLGQSR